uniref:Uncharacterized protein n=1 Tax=Glossina morsitans morsitans TaxID=37546 RepID=A0A1B0GCL2_GLOMM
DSFNGTLTATFAKYVDGAKTATTIRYADYFPIADIRSFQRELQKNPADQVAALGIFTLTYRPNAEPQTYAKVLDIDSIAMKLLPQMHEDVVLRTLYALFFLIPNWITRLDFYKAALNRLATNNEQHNESTNKSLENFIKSCFYLGLSKKNVSAKANASELLQNLLKQNLENHLDNMHTLYLAIVGNAIYKIATSVNIDKFNQRVTNEVLKLDIGRGQDGILITYLKLICSTNLIECWNKLEQITKEENNIDAPEGARGDKIQKKTIVEIIFEDFSTTPFNSPTASPEKNLERSILFILLEIPKRLLKP